jgi:hypothetical protein
MRRLLKPSKPRESPCHKSILATRRMNMSKEERANLIHPLMLELDVDAHRLYWLSDEELIKLAEKYL